MFGSVLVALIAGVVALCVAYVNGFVSDNYRRFRDGTALAASLSGELAAYEEAWPMLLKVLDAMAAASTVEKPNLSAFRPIERPKDLVYEKSIEKLGLLGAETVENVVYVYSNINAFRLAFELIAKNHSELSREELVNRIVACREALQRAHSKGQLLLQTLRMRAAAKFKPKWPWSEWSLR